MVFIIISVSTSLSIDGFFINTIYTVSGIMFSLGLGLIVTFNMNGVKNPAYISQIRENINDVRNSFLKYFILTTICYIVDFYLRQNGINTFSIEIGTNLFKFNLSILFCLLMMYSIIYYVINFIEIQNLNNDIFDKLREQN
ncbi:MAG: hypothetical protein ABJ387_01485 [Balneola sp.]